MRDRLALQRTRLANERTFLAYVRTALSLLAGSAVLFQFFASDPLYLMTAWLLVALGGAILVFGVARFFNVRRSLNVDDGSNPAPPKE